jgi:hypothetical protein
VFQKNVCSKSNPHFRFNNLPSENAAVYGLTGGKYGTARQATVDSKILRRNDKIFMRDI